jgi:hypothetical protein
MIANYSLNTNELNIDFLNSIKDIFENKNIEITISDEDEENRKLGMAMEEALKSETISYDDFLKATNEN